ncbi:hypothetical protein G7046_g7690 [Stylonectria norvegica]|nr:hypothetical protein G7046_g7690 [Stylonectria norvegica]
MPQFTLQAVSERSAGEHTLIVIDSKVYDITSYIEKHPGGDDILHEISGQDASEAFHEVGHSAEAKEALKELEIGDLDVSDLAPLARKPSKSQASGSFGSAVTFSVVSIALSIGVVLVWALLSNSTSQRREKGEL